MLVALCDWCLKEGKLTIAKGSNLARIPNYGADDKPSGLAGLMMGPQTANPAEFAVKAIVHFCEEHEKDAKDDLTVAERVKLSEEAFHKIKELVGADDDEHNHER